MDDEQFRVCGKEVIDYMVDFRKTVNERNVIPDVKPGYLKELLPSEAPQDPEEFKTIIDDFTKHIVTGTSLWGHRRHHAYFPNGESYASLIGDMLSGTIGSLGFSWVAGPSSTELEIIVLDWFAKALDLPEKFLSKNKGGGALQGSASDCIMMAFLSARNNALDALQKEFGYDDERKTELLPKLVAYTSEESHSSVEKAAKLSLVKLRILETTDEGNVSADTLEKAMAEDEGKGLKPFLYSAILGSTSQAAFDNISELGPVCRKRPHYFWLHVDGAYAGNAFICPEMRYLQKGLEYADSFNVNPNKWLLTLFDVSCLWVDNEVKFTKPLVVDPLYLLPTEEQPDKTMIDKRHFSIALSRRFRALKLWFTFRMYGIKNLQEIVRKHIMLAQYFKGLVEKDERFLVTNIVRCGLVCFRLKHSEQATKKLLSKITKSKELYMVPAKTKDKLIIRFCIQNEHASLDDMDAAWKIIQEHADTVIIAVSKKEKKPDTMKKKPNGPYPFKMIKNVTASQYANRCSRLYDGATPVLFVKE